MRTAINYDLQAFLTAVMAEGASMQDTTLIFPIPDSTYEIRPQAAWVLEPQAEKVIWVPLMTLEPDGCAAQPVENPWQPGAPRGILLAFELSEQVRKRLRDESPKLFNTQALPPPQFGEAAYVEDEEEGSWWEYSLAALDAEALGIWQRMSEILKALVAPAAWWPYEDLLALCATVEGYAQLRDRLKAESLGTAGAANRKAQQSQLRHLRQARQQAEALVQMQVRHQHQPEAYQERVKAFRELARQLATQYLSAHHHQKTSKEGAGRAIAGDTMALLLADSPPQVGNGSLTRRRDQTRQLEEVAHLPLDRYETPAYGEDRAIREASLAGEHAWVQENDTWRFHPSTEDLAVYFGDPKHPLDVADALKRLRLLGDSTVLTARIALSLWNQRRVEGLLSKNGDAAVRYAEIATLRGYEKRTRSAGPGKRHSDGYRPRNIQQIKEDLDLLQSQYLKGYHMVQVKNRMIPVRVDGPYLRVGPVSADLGWGDADVGVYLSPGPWINSYGEYNNWILAEIDEAIFRLTPGTNQVRLALYLVERWRQQAPRQAYQDPITMMDLLTNSVIEIDRKHLTDRFVPRIERAIADLCKRHIIGAFRWLTPVNREKPQWGNDWLAALVQVLPPEELINQYATRLENMPRRTLPSGTADELAE